MKFKFNLVLWKQPQIIFTKWFYHNFFILFFALNCFGLIKFFRFYDYVGSTQYGLCGGSLIDHEHIITAAHCVHDVEGNPRDVKAVQVFLGAHNVLLLPKARRVEKFILPHNYNFKKPVHNDFAILKLTKPVKFSSSISPICIPKTDSEPYRMLTVAGWGHLGPRRRVATALQHVDVFHVEGKRKLSTKWLLYLPHLLFYRW